MNSTFRLIALALALLLMSPHPASAAAPTGTLFAGYWSDFQEHWTKVLQQQNGITVLIVLVGIAALIIITRGKWLK